MTSSATNTPTWLLQPEFGLCPCGCIGRRSKVGFVDKTIRGGTGVLRQALFADDLAAEPGLLQRIDPRVKLVSVVVLLVAVALLRNTPVILAVYALSLLLARLSRVPLGFFVKRVWLFIPIFTGLVVLPATFSFVTPGHVVVPLGHWFGHRVGLTRQGLRAAGLIVTRVATSISLVVLVVLTTTWTRVLAALGSLRVPRMFVVVLGMAYRYVFQLLGTVTEMYESRRARTTRATRQVGTDRKFVAATAGALFGKAHALSEEVHLAMLSRGYSGRIRSSSSFRLARVDLVWILLVATTVATVIGVDRAIGR
jgi:cobalt ECF transporter T component CbiQ